jgi:hypothetical protein
MSVWTEFIKKWADQNNCSYGSAMSNKQCSDDYKQQKVTGDGFLSNASRKLSKAVIGKKATRNIESYGNAIINGRNDYPPKVRSILSTYGNEIITSAMIRRAPVQKAIVSALNAVSMGSFNKNLDKQAYDDLFHLQFYFVTQSGKQFVIEKNEVINMDINPKTPPNTESIPVPINSPVTIQQLADNTKAFMGNLMFGYSAKDNNCQDFVMGILNGNKIGSDEDRKFVKQDTDQLFQGDNNMLRRISNTVTSIGAKANVITTGAGVKKFRR